MEITARRIVATNKSTISEVTINGQFQCHFLEDPNREVYDDGEWVWHPAKKVYGQTCIPSGRYKIIVNLSNRFNTFLPLILDVPNFRGVRIHPGNTPENTEGCPMPGSYDPSKPDWVSQSRKAFKPLFAKIRGAYDDGEDVFITFINDFLPKGGD